MTYSIIKPSLQLPITVVEIKTLIKNQTPASLLSPFCLHRLLSSEPRLFWSWGEEQFQHQQHPKHQSSPRSAHENTELNSLCTYILLKVCPSYVKESTVSCMSWPSANWKAALTEAEEWRTLWVSWCPLRRRQVFQSGLLPSCGDIQWVLYSVTVIT